MSTQATVIPGVPLAQGHNFPSLRVWCFPVDSAVLGLWVCSSSRLLGPFSSLGSACAYACVQIPASIAGACALAPKP